MERIAAQGIEQIAFGLGFHPFGHHFQPQCVPHGDDCFDDFQIARIGEDVLHETLVDFQPVERELREVAQRGVAGAEIVQRELHAHAAQRVQRLAGLDRIGHQCGFGQLQL